MFFDYLTGGQVVAGSNPAVPTNLACYIDPSALENA